MITTLVYSHIYDKDHGADKLHFSVWVFFGLIGSYKYTWYTALLFLIIPIIIFTNAIFMYKKNLSKNIHTFVTHALYIRWNTSI